METKQKSLRWITLGISFIAMTSLLSYFHNKSGIHFNSLHFSCYHSMIIFDVWDNRGLKECHYSMCTSYENPGDKNIPLQSGLTDSNGNCFYAAHPPFGLIMSWLLLKIFHLPNTFHSLLALNIFYMFLFGVLLLLLLNEYLLPYDFAGKPWISILLPSLILTNLAAQKFFSSFFFLDNATLLVFTATLFLIYRIIRTKSFSNPQLIGLMLLQFFLTYSDWIGIFLAATLFSLAGKFQLTNSHRRKIRIGITAATLAAIFLIIIQYASISGFSSLIHYWKIRFISRSGFFGDAYSEGQLSILNSESYKNILLYLWHGFAPMIILLPALFIILKFANRREVLFPEKFLIIVSTLPIFLDYIIFFNNHASHSFYTVWIGIPILLLSARLFQKIFSINSNIGKTVLAFSIFISGFIMLKSSFQSNGLPDENKIDQLAQYIMSNSPSDRSIVLQIPDKLIFDSPYLQGVLTFKMKRNLLIANDHYVPPNMTFVYFDMNADFTLKK